MLGQHAIDIDSEGIGLLLKPLIAGSSTVRFSKKLSRESLLSSRGGEKRQNDL